MTAIAAVIALSATPAFAQDATQAVTQPPAVVAPLPPQPEAAPPEIVAPTSEAVPLLDAQPLEQADAVPAQSEVVQAPVRTPVPTMQPIINQPSAADLQAARIAERAPASPRATSPAAAERVRTEAPAAIAPVAVPAAVTRTAAPIAPPEQLVVTAAPAQRATTTATTVDEDALPYIGAGVAVVVIFGGVAALARRRRRDGDAPEERYENEHVLELEPAARVAEPWQAAPVMARAAPAPAAALPNGFDLSRFGRHTQAAYRGPTPDNRSLSLRTRLKRASFFDGRERIAAETGTAPVGIPIAAAARAAQAPVAADRQTVIRPRPANTGTFFRPSLAR